MGRFSCIDASFNLDTSTQGFTKVFHWTGTWTMFCLFYFVNYFRYIIKIILWKKAHPISFFTSFGVFFVLFGVFCCFLFVFIVLLFEIPESSFCTRVTGLVIPNFWGNSNFTGVIFLIGRCWSALSLECGYSSSQYALKQSQTRFIGRVVQWDIRF